VTIVESGTRVLVDNKGSSVQIRPSRHDRGAA
jgi:hypothetical protein